MSQAVSAVALRARCVKSAIRKCVVWTFVGRLVQNSASPSYRGVSRRHETERVVEIYVHVMKRFCVQKAKVTTEGGTGKVEWNAIA